jgi:hypothetical protein
MVVRSPFLRLDEMRRQDADSVLESVVDASRRFGEAPLQANKLLERQQERAALAKSNSQKLKVSQKLKEKELGDKYDIEKGKAAESARHNQATEEIQKETEKRRRAALDSKEGSNVLNNIALGELTDPKNKELQDEDIINGIMMHPSNTEFSREEVIKAYYTAKQKVADDENKSKLTQAKIDRINRRSVPKDRTPKPHNLDSKTVRDLAELETSSDRLKTVAARLSDAKTGLFQDLSQKFGQIIGIQDDTTRMAYLSEVNRLLKERSGAQVTPEEYQRLLSEFPDWKADSGILAERLLDFAEDKDRMYDAIIRTSDRAGRSVTNFSPRVKKDPPPPKEPGESSRIYAGKLKKLGYTNDEIFAIVTGAK